MSQRDVVAELRTARVQAPAELRERVRLIAVQGTPPPRRFRRRLAVAVVVPLAAALAGGLFLATRPTHHRNAYDTLTVQQGTVRAATTQGAFTRDTVPASPRRAQRYNASLTLRVANVGAVSDGVKRALRIAASFGGFPVSVHVASTAPHSSAYVLLKVPRAHVQAAIARLSQLGTITAEQVDLRDVQAGINAADRTMARLQKQLATLRAQPQTDATKRKIAALTARIVALQRGRAATIRAAHFATVAVGFTTQAPAAQKHSHGPLHGLGVAFRWLGIGLVYALALGVPAVAVVLLAWLAVRTVRRRREDALLNS